MKVVLASSPLSLHSRFPPLTSFHHHPPPSYSSSSSSSSSSSPPCFGVSISHHTHNHLSSRISCSRSRKKSRRTVFTVSAVFERFTERAIKSVIFSQREARALGKDTVAPQHLLLGLIVEDRDPDGFLGSGITIDRARDVVREIWVTDGDDAADHHQAYSATSTTDMPFSAATKRVFEAAVEYSRNMKHKFISPEHIAIGLFTVDDGSAAQVCQRYSLYVKFYKSKKMHL